MINELANITEYHKKGIELQSQEQIRLRGEKHILSNNNSPSNNDINFNNNLSYETHTTTVDFETSIQNDFVTMGGRSRTRTIEEDLEETGNELMRRLTDTEDALKSRTNPQTPVFSSTQRTGGAHSHNIMLIADEVDRITKQGSLETITLNQFESNLRRKSEALESIHNQYESKIIKLDSTITQLRNDVKRNEKSIQLILIYFFLCFNHFFFLFCFVCFVCVVFREKDRLIQELMKQNQNSKILQVMLICFFI